MESRLIVDLEKMAKIVNMTIPMMSVGCFLLGYYYSFYFHFGTVFFFILGLVNFFYLKVQTTHSLLRNYGIIAQARYMIESIGPELRQYLFSGDTEERPFNRVQRSEVYRKAKNVDSSSAFGSQLGFDGSEFKLRHSMYPVDKCDIKKFSLTFGEERGIENTYEITKPIMISAMSYGALGRNAVLALSKGAKAGGILLNTGEGGFPQVHIDGGADLIFQMGTAKFGVRHEDGTLDPVKLEKLAKVDQIKMIEIKLSQGAKPGKGGILPKEKITEEISKLRGVPRGKDVISPPYHPECRTPKGTVDFIKKVQDISKLPVGIKFCYGRPRDFVELLSEMKSRDTFPDYIAIDGAEGGTGAAPRSFMDEVGVPLFHALVEVKKAIDDMEVGNKFKLVTAGKLISPGKQFTALSLGADVCYSARGFMLAMGCIQALHCNNNTCPVGITTHDLALQKGLDIDAKAIRVENYIKNLDKDYYQLLSALGKKSFFELDKDNVLFPGGLNL